MSGHTPGVTPRSLRLPLHTSPTDGPCPRALPRRPRCLGRPDVGVVPLSCRRVGRRLGVRRRGRPTPRLSIPSPLCVVGLGPRRPVRRLAVISLSPQRRRQVTFPVSRSLVCPSLDGRTPFQPLSFTSVLRTRPRQTRSPSPTPVVELSVPRSRVSSTLGLPDAT